ncbi:hypothetical protein TGAM01_v203913 [Trichoderma gamsii]|uniref:Uncharacterized protein n=1 Tax=Trichoderma gamsii TaxID=398673 RepID=A0A0W7VCZ5_9HYPO|nr:hypothetical protein TGAM01_v203913 [Trichoderma gamsii]PNP39566.1 hypothetical protein TGAMA5MH_08585 [Trichoderma gamsii]PON26964.1 hypothetical protein TGAM01_v203913 [Trichoderma gamsii]
MKAASLLSIVSAFIAVTAALPVATKSAANFEAVSKRQGFNGSLGGHDWFMEEDENEATKTKKQGFNGSLGGHDWFKEEDEAESTKTNRQGFNGSLGGHDWFKEDEIDVN